MSVEQDAEREALPCGGCGAVDEAERCIGCLHDFTGMKGKLMSLPTLEERPDGLHQRYYVTKRYGDDDPRAMYFVLRLDQHGDDQTWIDCCREAAAHLCAALNARGHVPLVSHDLMRYLESTQTPDSPPLRFGATA